MYAAKLSRASHRVCAVAHAEPPGEGERKEERGKRKEDRSKNFVSLSTD
jgi:hypothetical protein